MISRCLSFYAALFLGIVCLPPTVIHAQISGVLQTLVTQTEDAEQQYGSALTATLHLERRTDVLGQQIERMKRDAEDGQRPWERYRLDQLLKDAQALSTQLKDLRDTAKEAENQFRSALEAILQRYDQLVQGATLDWQALGGRANGERLHSLIAGRTVWRNKMPVRGFGNLVIVDVDVLETDGPVEVREKADLLWDMAEHLEREATRLEARKQEFFEEIRLRKEVAEFLEEVALFEPRVRGGSGQTENQPDALGRPVVANGVVASLNTEHLFRLIDNYELLTGFGITSDDIPALVDRYDVLITTLRERAAHMSRQARDYEHRTSAMEEDPEWPHQ